MTAGEKRGDTLGDILGVGEKEEKEEEKEIKEKKCRKNEGKTRTEDAYVKAYGSVSAPDRIDAT